MPTCRAPRRPLATGERRPAGRLSAQERWLQSLNPYCQPLFLRRKPSSSSLSSAAVPGRRARSAASPRHKRVESRPEVGVSVTNGDALYQLTQEEWSICNLMVTVLQHKSTEEAQRIIAEVAQLALTRRLLARYSGVYADGHVNGEEDTRVGEEEDGRTQLIRHLQEHQRREAERRKQLCDANRQIQQGDIRARCRKLFNRGGVNGDGRALKAAKRRCLPHRCNSSADENTTQQQGGHVNVEEMVMTKTTVPVPTVPLNVPRRAKASKGVLSFDEYCADRYGGGGGGGAYSNESLASVLPIRCAAMSTTDDSVRRSNSFPSAGVNYDDHDAIKGIFSHDDIHDIHTNEAPSAFISTMRPATSSEVFNSLSSLSGPALPPSHMLDGHNGAGLLPIKPTTPTAGTKTSAQMSAKVTSSSVFSSLISPSSSSLISDVKLE
ncbi:hypothetical protein MOQ_001424 [Trypanosoma cruzi marinkellei]|uniref:Uncharacterized protein n=1 Tax=Trypanosoma cruzi marinkellei TaxID=85056 RepID=K2PB85_TRYCR|nr:hypothetical protein MOQ_001424 [Trypanosoma cruzi marinkellei]